MSQGRWDKYKVSGDNETMNSVDGNNSSQWDKYKVNAEPVELPGALGFALNAAPSFMSTKNYGEKLKERAAGLGRGFTDIGQGLKQMGLQAGETAGLVPSGSAEKYTEQKNNEEKWYQQSRKQHDKIDDLLRTGAASSPLLAFGLPAAMERSMIGRLLWGSAGGAAHGTSKYIPDVNQRKPEIIKETAMGAGLSLIPELPNMIMKTGEKIASPFRSLASSFKNLAPEKEAERIAEQGLMSSKESERLAKEKAESEIGMTSPGKVEFDRQKKIKELENLNGMPGKSNAPILSSKESERLLNEANSSHELSKKELNEVDENISSHLNKGAMHDVRTAAKIDEIQQNRKNVISKKYDNVQRNLEDKNIVLENKGDAKKIAQDMKDLIAEGGLDSPEVKKLAQELENVNRKEIIPANDYLTMYRSAKDYARQARTKAYTPGMNAEERALWKKRYNELDEKVEEMGSVLEKGIGEGNSLALKEANKDWREQVIPLYRNRTYQNIVKSNKMPENIMKTLRGKEPGDVILRDMIKNDPELLRNVVGQRFSHNPAKLHDIGELEQEYVDKMPELKSWINKRESSLNKIEQAKSNAEKASAQHEFVKESEIKAQKLATKEEKKIQENKDKMTKLDEEIQKIDKHLPSLKEASDRKNISLKEHVNSKKAYQEAKMKKKDAIRKRNKYAMIAAIPVSGAIGTGITKSLKSLVSLANGNE